MPKTLRHVTIYNRIIPGVGNLASRYHSIMHRLVALVQGRTLEEVHYHLKTPLGITKENYKHCQCFPIYGTRQGSGNSPAVWLVIGSVLFNCYEEKAYSAVFGSPDRTIRMKLFCSRFVDDTAGYVNKLLDDIPPSPEEMIRMLIHMIPNYGVTFYGRRGEPSTYQSVCITIGTSNSHRPVDRTSNPPR
jgi:hypothetical protein